MRKKKINTFKQLQAKWYKKLAKTGFIDIEKGDRLKQHASHPYRNAYRSDEGGELLRDSKQKYFELLSYHIQIEKFDCSADEIIMKRISEGAKIKTISAELRKLGHKNERKTIRYVIRKYEHRWNIKNWKPEQLTRRRN